MKNYTKTVFIRSSVANFILHLDVIVKFEIDVCEGGDNFILVNVSFYFFLSHSFLVSPAKLRNIRRTIFVTSARKFCGIKLKTWLLKERSV